MVDTNVSTPYPVFHRVGCDFDKEIVNVDFILRTSTIIVKKMLSTILRRLSLQKHAYSNILKILPPKNGNFSDKKI